MKSSFPIAENTWNYLLNTGIRQNEFKQRIRDLTVERFPQQVCMLSNQIQSEFMEILIKSIQASKVIDVGVFTGLSALTFAFAVPDDGKVYALDISEEFTSVGRQVWAEAGVDHRIELRLKPALESLQDLIDEGLEGQIDIAFIDAHKPEYPDYYEKCLQLLKPNGLILVDNAIWSGKVVDESIQDEETIAIRRLNEIIRNDPRVQHSLLPISDGINFVIKK